MVLSLDSTVFFALLIVLTISLTALVFSLLMHLRVKKIFKSASAPDIERLLKLHTNTLEDFVKFKAESTKYMNSLHERIKRKAGNAANLRFNPFPGEGIGNNQSFSSVFVDETGNGVIITSMHTRERTNVFAKPLKNWVSEYQLSDEELQIINQAKKNDSQK